MVITPRCVIVPTAGGFVNFFRSSFDKALLSVAEGLRTNGKKFAFRNEFTHSNPHRAELLNGMF